MCLPAHAVHGAGRTARGRHARPTGRAPGTRSGTRGAHGPQRLLEAHLRERAGAFWADSYVNLSGATLVDLDFEDCRLRAADFVDALFVGHTTFRKAAFTGQVRFTRAIFDGWPSFEQASFAGKTWFTQARFTDTARFEQAGFGAAVRFDEVSFGGWVEFKQNDFAEEGSFRRVVFGGTAWFADVRFHGVAASDGARFDSAAQFLDIAFAHGTPPEVAPYVMRRPTAGEQAG